jgi:pSer/pThr/pTyr-binding forkhead associated (FHA) protein
LRLVVRQGDRVINEFRFEAGPVRIGRHVASHVCLHDKSVSKQHAVIYCVEDAQWMAEDLDSANKTYLNNKPIHKAKIKTGDILRIADYSIEVNFNEVAIEQKPTPAGKIAPVQTTEVKSSAATTVAGKTVAGKTVTGMPSQDKSGETRRASALLARDAQIIARKPGAEKPAPIRFQGERAADFLKSITQISRVENIDGVLSTLLEIIPKQFKAYQIWCALRTSTDGLMTTQSGIGRDGKSIDFETLKINEKIDEAIANGEFLLFVFSRIPGQEDKTSVRSVLIAPVVSSAGCFGAVYVNNCFLDDHYNLGDLDYLMLLTMHTATVLERFKTS